MAQIGKPLRLAESAVEAALVLGLVLLPAGWHAAVPGQELVLAGMQVLLTLTVYALHAVTFDDLRLTGQRRPPAAHNPGVPGAAFGVEAREAALLAAGPARPGGPFRYTHREG